MPIHDQLRGRCQALLDPGESISYLIPTTAVGVGVVASTVDGYVVVTDRRVVVIVGELRRRDHPSEITAQYPRATRLGPVEFTPTPLFRIGSRFYEIDDEYVAAVHAADAELDGPDAVPQDPFPDR